MSALDLVLMTHTTKCNQTLLEGNPCICGVVKARKELNALVERIAQLEAAQQSARLTSGCLANLPASITLQDGTTLKILSYSPPGK